jgi:dihydroflavonol-4-reductase
MKVLVTGATGFIGSWIVQELLAAGHSARVLTRGSSNLQNLQALLSAPDSLQRIERADGDVLQPASLRAAVTGCDAVIHTAGIAHFKPDDTPMMYRVNVDGVRNVLEAALAAGVQRAVLTSSVAAMGGGHKPRVADEQTPSNAESLGIDYNTSKLRGELVGMELHKKGLPLIVLRPVVALGPGDIYHSSTSTFLALARRKLPVFVDGGASFGDVRDMARAHVAALTQGRVGQAYILGGHNLEMAQLIRTVETLTGVPGPRRVPFTLAHSIAGAVELTMRALGKRTDLSRQLVKASHLYTWVSSDKAKAELAYAIRPLDESLIDTYRYFLQAGRLSPVTPELKALAQR